MYAVARVGIWLIGAGPGLADSAVVLVFVGGAALAAYVGAALLLKTEELSSATSLLRGRLIGNAK
jgi:putative peptidoglycan lipid II flippase